MLYIFRDQLKKTWKWRWNPFQLIAAVFCKDALLKVCCRRTTHTEEVPNETNVTHLHASWFQTNKFPILNACKK